MRRLSLPRVALLLLFLFTEVLGRAQLPDTVQIWKLEQYTQTDAVTQKHGFSELLVMVSYAAGAGPAADAKLELHGPGGRTLALALQPDGSYEGEEQFDTLAAMDTAYPDADYTLAITTGADTQSVTIGLLSGLTVSPVKITNFNELQAWPSPKPLVKWEPVFGATYSDSLTLDVYDASGKDWFTTGPYLSKQATSAEVTGIPLNTPLLGQLIYGKFTITLSSGVRVYSGRAFAVYFPLQTAVVVPVITSQPKSVVLGSDPVTLSVAATGDNLTYAWNAYQVSDRNQPSLITGEPGVYTVTISNGNASVISAPAVVARMSSPPAQQVAATNPVTFSVLPSSPLVQYQWYRDGLLVPGATAAEYTLKGATPADAGRYTVRITSAGSSIDVGSSVLVVAPGVQSTTYAGTSGAQSQVDGPRATATFLRSTAVATDSSGNVYVADQWRIRRIGTDGNVTTVATIPEDGTYGLSVIASNATGDVFVGVSPNAIDRVASDGTITRLTSNLPSDATGLVCDSHGTLYVACGSVGVIVKVASDGTTTLLAGQKSVWGPADGQGAAATFNQPSGLALDGSGNLWVADTGNEAIRRIDAAGNVTTIVGFSSANGVPPGLATAVRLSGPSALAFDAAGNLYIACFGNLVRLTPEGLVQALSASLWTYSLAMDRSGHLYAPTGQDVIMALTPVEGSSDPAIAITTSPASMTMGQGSTAVLQVAATGPALTYQWLHDGAVVPGANSAMLVLSNFQGADAGSYSVRIGNAVGATTSAAATVALSSSADVGRLTNLSIRARAGTGAQTLIVGAGLAGGTGGAKPLLVRGIGPTLAKYHVTGPLAAPVLTLLQDKTVLATNAGWGGDPTLAAAFSAVQAFPLETTSGDVAMLPSLRAGVYTIQVTGQGAGTGVALAELYDADAGFDTTHPQLVNVSARCYAGTGADVLIAGFGVGGSTAKTVLVRGIGPTLWHYGVTGFMNDPQLEIRDASGTIVASNDDWQDTPAMNAAFDAVSAFHPQERHDAAILITLPPGTYTAQVKGAYAGTGVALVEVYALP